MIADEMTWKEIKRKVREMATMENNLRQAQGSRDYWKDMHDRYQKLVEEAYVMLPLDADGAPIHVGDSVGVICGEDGKVVAVELGESGWSVSIVPAGWDVPTLHDPSSLRHRHERTVEDVLRELVEVAEDTSAGRLDDGDIQGFADEIRQMLDD